MPLGIGPLTLPGSMLLLIWLLGKAGGHRVRGQARTTDDRRLDEGTSRPTGTLRERPVASRVAVEGQG